MTKNQIPVNKAHFFVSINIFLMEIKTIRITFRRLNLKKKIFMGILVMNAKITLIKNHNSNFMDNV